MDEITIVKDSKYWKEQKEKAEDRLSELMTGETAGISSTKSNDDSIQFNSISDEYQYLLNYISYCEKKYNEALEEEGAIPKSDKKRLLYFDREYGY